MRIDPRSVVESAKSLERHVSGGNIWSRCTVRARPARVLLAPLTRTDDRFTDMNFPERVSEVGRLPSTEPAAVYDGIERLGNFRSRSQTGHPLFDSTSVSFWAPKPAQPMSGLGRQRAPSRQIGIPETGRSDRTAPQRAFAMGGNRPQAVV